jgi:hypothetical protein
MIDMVLRSQAYAVLANKKTIQVDDFFLGVKDAMLGRIRARGGDSFTQNMKILTTFINNNFQNELTRASKRYWCRYFRSELKSNEKEGKRVLKVVGQVSKEPKLLSSEEVMGKIGGFSKYVMSSEGYAANMPENTVLLTVFRLMDESLTCEGEVEL